MRERPDRDQTLMEMAILMSRRSTCDRRQVGVVLSKKGRILMTGYNGAPPGMVHCSHECDCGYPGKEGLIFGGRHLSNCASEQSCTIAVHAEANAIAFAARHGVKLQGADLHCTDGPCKPCAQLMLTTGILRVVYARPFRDLSGVNLLRDAGVNVERAEWI